MLTVVENILMARSKPEAINLTLMKGYHDTREGEGDREEKRLYSYFVLLSPVSAYTYLTLVSERTWRQNLRVKITLYLG